jgi:hypothetical protein
MKEKLRAEEKSLVGNKGYRRYLSSTGADQFQVDEAKAAPTASPGPSSSGPGTSRPR